MDEHDPVEPSTTVDPARAPEPSSSPTQAPPATYWASPPGAGPGTRRASAPFLIFLWACAMVAAAFNARIASGRDDSAPGSSQWWAYLAGAFLGPFLFALVLRAAYVLISRWRRSGSRPLLRSQWLPLGALLLAGINLTTNVTALGPPRPVTPSDAIRISGPFTLRPASAQTRQIAEAGFTNDKTIRAYEVREIVGDDGSLSLLVVTDAGIRDEAGALERIGRGIESSSGLTATYETIHGQRVTIAVGETLSIGGWIEEPLGVFVYAVTPTRLRQIIDAVVAAPRPRT